MDQLCSCKMVVCSRQSQAIPGNPRHPIGQKARMGAKMRKMQRHPTPKAVASQVTRSSCGRGSGLMQPSCSPRPRSQRELVEAPRAIFEKESSPQLVVCPIHTRSTRSEFQRCKGRANAKGILTCPTCHPRRPLAVRRLPAGIVPATQLHTSTACDSTGLVIAT